MCLIRRTEEAIAHRYRQGKMRLPVHLSIGQEGAAVGAMMAMPEDAHVFASHRSHHPYLAKGGSLAKLVAELYGRATGCTQGWGGSMYLIDPSCGFIGSFAVVGDCIAVATGAALAFQLAGSARIAVAYFGDAAPETGQFWESLNFAALHKLPLLYVCENNGYATQTPIAQRQPVSPPLWLRVRGFGIPSWGCEDQPQNTYSGVEQLLTQGLPALLEIQTYRYREHVGPDYDWDLGYRTRQEVEHQMSNDPFILLEDALRRDSGDAALKPIWAETDRQISRAFSEAEEAPWPMSEWEA